MNQNLLPKSLRYFCPLKRDIPVENQPPLKNSQPPRKEGPMAGLSYGLEFAVTALLGMALGHWIDRKWDFSPWGLILGLFVGAAVGMVNLARKVK